MKAINELIGMGFDLSVKDGNIKMEHKGSNPPDIAKVKPLIEELKLHKEQAIKYIESLIIYEIPEGVNFDFQVQGCLEAAYDNDIEWLRTDVYKKSRKVVLVGAIKKPELVKQWQDCCRDVDPNSEYARDCPWGKVG